MEKRNCTRCEGSGVSKYDSARVCYACNGARSFDAPDLAAIVNACKGRKARSLRSARPKDARAYYVWRMARFHGGADCRMPVMADLEVSGDPFRPELDKIGEALAKIAFGTDLAATRRWSRALYGADRIPDAARISPVTDTDRAVLALFQ